MNTMRPLVLCVAVGLVATTGCGGGVSEVNTASGAQTLQAKCKASISDCDADAREQCHGDFRTIASESHAGGIFADALPGPVTWYTLRFTCGAPEDYHGQIEAVIASNAAEIYWPICEVPPRPGKACGLIANKFTAEWVASYTKHICHEDGEAPSDQCVAQIVSEFRDEVTARYSLANRADVERACTSAPAQCNTLERFELLYLASHDDVVFKRERHGLEEIVARAAEDESATDAAREELAQEDAHRRQAGAAVAAVGAAFQGFADGWNATQASSPAVRSAETTQRSSGPKSCTGDFSCGIGAACVKNQFESTGTCAKTVDQNGVQTFGPADPASVGVGHPNQCSFNTDCTPGFHCMKGNGTRARACGEPAPPVASAGRSGRHVLNSRKGVRGAPF